MNEGVRNIQLSFEDLAFVIRDSALVIDDFSPLAQDAVMQLIDPYGKSADQRAGQSSGPDQQEIAEPGQENHPSADENDLPFWWRQDAGS